MATGIKSAGVRSYLRLLGYVWPFAGAFVISVVGYLIYAVSNVAFIHLVEFVVDHLGGQSQSGRSLLPFLTEPTDDRVRLLVPAMLVLVALMRGLGSFVGNYFIVRVSTNLVHSLRCDIFEQLLKLPSHFYDRNTQGHLVARMTFHVNQVTAAATTAIRVIIREGFTVLAYLAYMLYLNWLLTLIFLVAAPLIGVLVGWAGRRFRVISHHIQDSMGDVTHVTSEVVQGYREVRAFAGEDYERNRFLGISNYNRRQSMKMAATASISTPAIQFIVAGLLALLVWLLLDPLLLENMTAGNVIGFIVVAGLITKPLRQLTEINEAIQKGLAAARDIFSLLDQPREANKGSRMLGRAEGRVQFHQISFAYNREGPLVLDNISFEVQAGQTVALVGRSGSGKSTLASLIPRFYKPDSGQILIDGLPVEDIDLQELRKQIAIVPQQVTLFNDTVANNIAYGSLAGATTAEIEEAARKAYALGFIEKLDEGMETLVGDDGILLSGGQRQRLAIARAFLKDAPILILDEATSALDAESERQIQLALRAVAEGRTTFVIAHRLSTIEAADVILVMHDGCLVEQGRHSELLRKGGHYARLQKYQLQGEGRFPEQATEEDQQTALPDNLAISEQPLVNAWYRADPRLTYLWPLSLAFRYLTRLRRVWYRHLAWKASVPLVVVGNISLGGTGKTPLVMYLANRFRELGLRTGVVTRGFGGRTKAYPVQVVAGVQASEVGDEAVMIAQNCKVPLVVDPNRVRAARHLLENSPEPLDLILSDDGLQHYALARDLEIAVVDGGQGLGNGLCLPAGPLREPPDRLQEVDFLVQKGTGRGAGCRGSILMKLVPASWLHLATGKRYAVEAPPFSGQVHAVAAIGFPGQFFQKLRSLGFSLLEHAFPDHFGYRAEDLLFGDQLPVVMTEKDAVKVIEFRNRLPHDNYWVLEVRTELDQDLAMMIVKRLQLTAGGKYPDAAGCD